MDSAVFRRVLSIVFLFLALFVQGAGGAQARQDAGDRPSSTGIDQREIIGRYAANYAYVEKDNGTTATTWGSGLLSR